MKRTLTILLLIILIFSFSSCKNEYEDEYEYNDTSTFYDETSLTESDETIIIVPETTTTTVTTQEPQNIISENPFSVNFRYIDDNYTFFYKPSITGLYWFDLGINDVNFDYNLKIYDSINEQKCDVNYSDYRHGDSVKLIKDNIYTIVLYQKEGLPTATISIGIPNPDEFINGNLISGEIEYIDQENTYILQPQISGNYRFDFLTNDVNYDYTVILRDSINDEKFNTHYSTYTNGQNIYLNEDENYKLTVKYRNNFPKYKIKISKPLAPINVDTSFSGSITFIGQENTYYYTPPKSGTYNISLSFSDANSSCKLIMLDSINKQLFSTNYTQPQEVVLEKGVKYTFIVKHLNSFVNYNVNIERVNQTTTT